ncbi:hypothetical protein SDC9_191129 [bioreactor metagenome]|uniref:Uncharacterized protein n=1 Tax=bioreactor metagenome TaxID=1076179 RepID=A0A645HZE7_9ZZZZ
MFPLAKSFALKALWPILMTSKVRISFSIFSIILIVCGIEDSMQAEVENSKGHDSIMV